MFALFSRLVWPSWHTSLEIQGQVTRLGAVRYAGGTSRGLRSGPTAT